MWKFWLHRSVPPLFAPMTNFGPYRSEWQKKIKLLAIEEKYLKKWAITFFLELSFSISGLYIGAIPLSSPLASHLLISGYKGRGKEGLGLRGGLVSKVLESRTKS